MEVIRRQRINNVTLNIAADNGKPYTGLVQVTQESTQFVYSAGRPDEGIVSSWEVTEQKWVDYAAMTPSRTYHIWAPWNIVESTEGIFDFGYSDHDYRTAVQHGMSEFHIELAGPIMRDPSAGCCTILPKWARTLNHTSLLIALQRYVTALVTHFKGRVHYYQIWDEANAYYGNGNLPIEQIIDTIKMEATTIRAVDPDARICIDLENITPNALQWQSRWGGSNWTTENFVQELVAAEVPFDVIGLETHIGTGPAPREGGVDTLYNRLIELGKLGKPIYVWEDGLESYIDPKYQSQMGGDFWVGPWRGTPNEEKQAEFMVAETLVYLGNPSVLGARWVFLADQADWSGSFWAQYYGVLYANETRKLSFYALQNLWGNLTINTVLHSTGGVAVFSGLAGTYTVGAEGYRPIKISVVNGATNFLNINLVSLVTATNAATASSTITHSGATSTYAGQPSWVTMVVNALLTTSIGNLLLVALALTIAIATTILVRAKITRSFQQNKDSRRISNGKES